MVPCLFTAAWGSKSLTAAVQLEVATAMVQEGQANVQAGSTPSCHSFSASSEGTKMQEL